MKFKHERNRNPRAGRSAVLFAAVILFLSAAFVRAQDEPATEAPPAPQVRDEFAVPFGEINRLKTEVTDIDPDEYTVDSGDSLTLHIWKPGLSSSQVSISVINGKVFLEMVGEVAVGGLSLRETIDKITATYKEKFPQFRVFVTLSSIRTFQALVSGQVGGPGFVRVNPLTRLSTVVGLAGGVSNIGSEREVQVKGRDGTVRKYDLTKFRENGDIGQNPEIRNGDWVHVPVRYGVVEVRGDVLKPGRYEIVEGESLQSLKYFFKGLRPDAYRPNLALHRPTSSLALGEGRYSINKFTWEQFEGDFGANLALTDGDILLVESKVERELIIVQGGVGRPGSYNYVRGMRITDALNLAGGYMLNFGAGVSGETKIVITSVESEKIKSGQTYVVDFDDLIVRGDKTLDREISPGDIITVMTRPDVVYVHGKVAGGGAFPYDPSKNVRDYILLGGGPNSEGNVGGVKLFRGEEILHPGMDDSVKPGDTIYVPSSRFVRVRKSLQMITEAATFYFLIDSIESRR